MDLVNIALTPNVAETLIEILAQAHMDASNRPPPRNRDFGRSIGADEALPDYSPEETKPEVGPDPMIIRSIERKIMDALFSWGPFRAAALTIYQLV